MVKVIESVADWDALMQESKEKAVIVDFYAVWCGPCRVISPIFEQNESSYPTIIFAKLDVDALSQISSKEQVSAMPSFFVYQNGQKVDEVIGANVAALTGVLEKYK
mmetsp:Transcript_2020/g.3581  ORF Transcript_2020/g.3581 Transcript_2020/m.3581 type:complete len:106 (-) Transcript_2020:180-497(-)|eukprot:CAMPEP_0182441066 /NCGR_PEP_ID=MMETSP1172-20130603/31_1 /TAXON_ID=708627 /ORGANISM="Timspurckia oligopyrenoides, Strain CCMP3278" /LENGTH=105 /DNA_ID=CAMNT_0024635207 /DNA_START=109 /DNA_END=426 /DNA_ORIENTATION=-